MYPHVKINRAVKAIIKNCVKLAKEGHVPFIFAYQTLGSIRVVGTKNVEDNFLEILNIPGNNFVDCFKEDKLGLIRGEDSLNIDTEENTNEMVQVILIEERELPEKLVRPLSLQNMKHDTIYLRKLILQSAHSKGLSGHRVSFEPEWEPSWWPSHKWPWHLVSNFDRLSKTEWIERGLPRSPADFIKEAVRAALEFYGLDPEEWVQDAWAHKKDEQIRAKRRRGISCRDFIAADKIKIGNKDDTDDLLGEDDPDSTLSRDKSFSKEDKLDAGDMDNRNSFLGNYVPSDQKNLVKDAKLNQKKFIKDAILGHKSGQFIHTSPNQIQEVFDSYNKIHRTEQSENKPPEKLVRRLSLQNMKHDLTYLRKQSENKLPEKLVIPLSFQNMKHDLTYLRKLILKSAHSKGLSGNRVSFEPEWEPSWWPSHKWPWHLVTNFDRLSRTEWIQRGLPGSPSSFVKEAVKAALESYGVDPEEWVEDAWAHKWNEEVRAKKRRGISVRQVLVDSEGVNPREIKQERQNRNNILGNHQGNDQTMESYVPVDQPMDSSVSTDQTIGSHVQPDQTMDGFRSMDQTMDSFRSMDQTMDSYRSIDQTVDGYRSMEQTMDSYRSMDQTMDSIRSMDQSMDNFLSADQIMDSYATEDQALDSYRSRDHTMSRYVTRDESAQVSNNPMDSSNKTDIVEQEQDTSISDFLKNISLEQLSDLFISEDVNMKILLEMTEENLKDLGVTKYGQRFKILSAVKSLK